MKGFEADLIARYVVVAFIEMRTMARNEVLGYPPKYDYFQPSMQRLITLGILLCMLSSAHREPSAGLLGQEKMISILVDLEVAKAMAWHYTSDEDTARALFQKNALLIYQAYGIDLDTFQKSYQYYLTHLEMIEKIYEVVVKRLEALEELI